MKTMAITAIIQYILTAAQSFDFQDCYYKPLITIFGLAGVLFCKKNEQIQIKLISVCLKDNTCLGA